MRYCGIRARLLFLALTPAAAVAAVMLILLVNARLARFNNELQSEAQLIARQWAPAIERARDRNDLDMLRNISQAAVQSRHVDRFRVLDQQGRILVDSREERRAPDALLAFVEYLLRGLPAGSQLQPATAVLPLRSGSFAGASLRPVSAGSLGTLEIEMPVSDALRGQLTELTFSALLALAVLLCAALLALITAGTILRPMRRLTQQVQKLEHDSLQSWAPSGCQGQLGQLETAIGAMIWALRHRQYRLEERIRRTASELRQTLRALEVQNAELDVARRRALEASTIKSQFLANVSHEIRTPINGIVGFAELLRHTPLDAEQRDHVDTIKVSCANLLTIINDILDVSKIEAGKLEIDSMAFDPRDSVEEVVTLLAPTAYSKGLELIQVVCADVPPSLNGDPTRIRQILTNLVHNAIKFTPQGQVVVRVILDEESASDATLRITISDTGVGLSEADRSKLFRAFGQAGDAPGRHFAGTGLGLIISKKLVEQMGGTIGLESEPQQGSTFWFTLCLQKPRSAQAAAATGLSPLLDRQILLLDDEPLSQDAAQSLLAPWGVDLTVVANEAQFLDRLDRGPWDAAIVSVAREALHRDLSKVLLRRCVEAHVPLMILASTVERAQLRRFCKNGASTALPKASRRQTMLRELCRLIGTPSPLAPCAAPDEVSAHGGDPEPSSASPLRVLVVDDNGINRKLVRCIAAQQGAWVDEACNGLEAMVRCQERDYDVIFMDILMPGLGGEEAAHRIRELYPCERAPQIVALTANAMPGERERLLSGGMDECLIKPITEEQVVRCLRRRGNNHPALNSPSMATAGGAAAAENPLAAELTQMFRVELPEHGRRIRDAYRREDMTGLREHVHRLHGAASICRITRLQSACRNLEDALITGKHRAITGGMKRLLTEIARLQRGDRTPPPPLSV